LFRSAVEGEVIEVTNANIDCISAVCDEFGFGSLSQRLRGFKDGPAHQQKVRVGALEERVHRLEADVQALQGSHQTAAAQAGLESDVRTLIGWAGPRVDSAIVSTLPPIFARPAAATTAALRPRGRSHPQVCSTHKTELVHLLLCVQSISKQRSVSDTDLQQHFHHKQRFVIDNGLNSLQIFLCSAGECPR
jgi:hypothetical protein